MQVLTRKRARAMRSMEEAGQAADDIAQESLVAAITGLPSHCGEGRQTAWADSATVSSTFAEVRRTRRAGRRVEQDADLLVVRAPGSPPAELAAQTAQR